MELKKLNLFCLPLECLEIHQFQLTNRDWSVTWLCTHAPLLSVTRRCFSSQGFSLDLKRERTGFSTFSYFKILISFLFSGPPGACILISLGETVLLLGALILSFSKLRSLYNHLNLKLTYLLEIQMVMRRDAGLQKVKIIFHYSFF